MNVLLWLVDAAVSTVHLARRRTQCLRRGHNFMCVVDGHVCRACGRFWCFFD